MNPSVDQVKTRFRALLSDPNGATFTDSLFAEAFGEAWDALFNAFLNMQCPRIKIITNYALPAGATSLTPETAGIADFADIDELEERLFGSSERYFHIQQVDKLPQRDMGDKLLEFEWRFDTFYFVGATTTRDLRITYESSAQAPTSGMINVDGSLTFLAKASAAMAGPLKGYDELAGQYRLDAYGPRYDQGVIGGELFRIIQPRVRQMQHVQIANKPYSISRRTQFRRVPYITAPPAGGGAPGMTVEFSSAIGTVTGAIDGNNLTFYLPYPPGGSPAVFLNGVLMTQGVDINFTTNVITFIYPQVPQPGAIITVKA